MSDKLIIEQSGHVVTLTLNQPETMNAITDADMVQAIVDAMDAINRDQSVRCAIITGAGRAFSSGGNIKKMQSSGDLFAGDAVT
ncbi:MAG: enoyl-CoA hydratase-related protein, partial [Pseudomonadota bacterium]